MTRRRELWTHAVNERIGAHELVQISLPDEDVKSAVTWAASIVPRQYATGNEIAAVLRELGKSKAADFIEGKLPTTKKLRSGELGEILGTQYATQQLGYRMIARLRWKDSRDMAMRGDDLVGIREDGAGQLSYLKGEAKSRSHLGKTTLAEAQAALFRHRGRPAPHTLSFLASRLRETGQTVLGMQIHDATLKNRIPRDRVTHLIFTLSGNSAQQLLKAQIASYRGNIRRHAVGVHVSEHQKFIQKVYSKVIQDARTR